MDITYIFLVILLLFKSQTNGQFDPNCDGKQVIVHLFEWKWTDIAVECERYLAPMGYCGVQISPPNEHVAVPPRPWWERYETVSYKLTSRGGTEKQLRNMVTVCNEVGVRVYVDAVINHMAVLGRNGTGIAGSPFSADDYDFPGVPYTKVDFHSRDLCPSSNGTVTDYTDFKNVRNCNFMGMSDLDQSKAHVRQKIIAYLDSLIEIGVAGFRFDASEYMWPSDLTEIIQSTNNLSNTWFEQGTRPFFYHEVIDRNEGAVKTQQYERLGLVTEFRYGQNLASGIEDFDRLHRPILIDYGMGMEISDRALVFVDNHDSQRGQAGAGSVVTFKEPKKYKLAVAFMLAYDYGFTRVMSSYRFVGDSEGPPHNADYSVKDVTINADGSCGNGWVCEHRWKPIANMVKFRNAVVGTSIMHWRDENNIVSFSRGQNGFFAMSKNGTINVTMYTGLPAGEYCDIIHDCAQNITVDGRGEARIVTINQDEPIVAFYEEPVSVTSEQPVPTNTTPVTLEPTQTRILVTVTTKVRTTTGSMTTQLPTISMPETAKLPTTSAPVTAKLSTTSAPVTTKLPTTTAPVTTKVPTTSAPVTTKVPTTTESVTTQLPMASASLTTNLPTTAEPVTTQLPITTETITTQLLRASEHMTTHLPTTFEPLSTELPMTFTPVTTKLVTTTEVVTTQLPTTSKPLKTELPTTATSVTTKLLTTTEPVTTQQPTTSAPVTTQISTKTERVTIQLPTTFKPATTKLTTASVSTQVPVSPSTPTSWKRTVVFILKQTKDGEDIFLRGGLDESRISGCSHIRADSECAIPIRHRNIEAASEFPKFQTWARGDMFLDWDGAEPGQGSYQGHVAVGTPALWTTNDVESPSYNRLNTWGDHYWMMDVDMDCSKADGGWFEFKAYGPVTDTQDGTWESEIGNQDTCLGTAGETKPFTSNNHVARCGFVNIFHFSENFCQINSF